MKLILISDNGRHHKKITLDKLFFISLFLCLLFIMTLLIPGLKKSKTQVVSVSESHLLNKFDSLLLKTAKLEGQVKRLNSLGKIIATKNNIDIQAYLLAQAPAMGGLGKNIDMIHNQDASVITQESLTKSISDLELELELQQQRYDILNTAKNIGGFQAQQKIHRTNGFMNYSTPVLKGYVSSTYGNRRDPFNGHQRHHNGIDIAAKHGSEIHSIASGFVTFAGRKGAYGNVIDINHSDTLKSRYAHLNSMNVKKGDVVRKGDTIATMGKTGRATGSHLHLEVWNKSKPVNPEAYIDIALIK